MNWHWKCMKRLVHHYFTVGQALSWIALSTMHANIGILVQVHEQHPNNLEALKFMVQLAGDLEDESKRVTYEAALIRVERILAMQDHVPSLSIKQSTARTQNCSPHMGLGAQNVTVTQLAQPAHWDQTDLSSCPDSGFRSASVNHRMSNGAKEDILGEDLLPGLGDM